MRQEVLTGIERRRRWSDAEKRSILAEVGVKGARVSDVARRHDLTQQHIYQWRGEFRRRGESLVEETGFLPVEITAAPTVVTSAPVATATVEIVLANGRRLRGIDGLSRSGLAQLIRVPESA
jgi:transposase